MSLPPLPEPIGVQHDESVGVLMDTYYSRQMHEYGHLCQQQEREACAKVCESRYMGDNNREDMEARRCADAIRSRT